MENLWRHWGLSQEYGFANQPATFTGLTDAVPLLNLGHSIHRFSVAALYYPGGTSGRLRPYALAGPGLSLFRVHEQSRTHAAQNSIHLDSSWKLAMTWGAGAKYMIRDRLGIGLRFGDAFSRLPSCGLPATKGASIAGFRPEGFLHLWQMEISFIYQWDGGHAK